MNKTQRILDPIHGLIAFDAEDETDRLAWAIINTRAFQRLRGIRQLGLAELVFPGATHSRFSHSIGVFHTARQLLAVIARKLGENFDPRQARSAALAALVHDIGHGAFSHVFERAQKARGVAGRHEEWTRRIIEGDSEAGAILREAGLVKEIAGMIDPPAGDASSVYGAIVSSQFDADRLDYLRRDRYMTGIGSSMFDFDWLLDCLEIDGATGALYISHKGLRTGEEYLLARYHLYLHVYMHKTVRGAEAMLCEILRLAAETPEACGLEARHPLRVFYTQAEPELKRYLPLDDQLIWDSLPRMADGGGRIAKLARRLRRRELYKCFEPPQAEAEALDAFGKKIRQEIPEALLDAGEPFDLYKKNAAPIRIGKRGGGVEQISESSRIIRAIPQSRLFRVYLPDEAARARAREMWAARAR